MQRLLGLTFAVLGALQAQQVVAPTTEQVGSPRGDNVGNYNVTQSFETGYRFHLVGGDVGEYRSDANYGNGLRLLGSSLTVNSKDGHGTWFDEIVLNTSGLGNDPYESAVLRIQKNGLYRYDMTWRLSDYYNPGLTVAGGEHLMDTGRRLQDHDLTLLPQSRIRFHLGYSRDTEDGPALSTAQEFNAAGTAYPIFTNVRRQWNEYRLGAEGEFAGFHFTLEHRWDYFKDDTPVTSDGVVASGSPTDSTVVRQFNRSQPIHGSSPGWMGNLHRRSKIWGMNARLTYVGGLNDFALDESVLGLGATGAAASRQIVVGGDARRPDLAGDFALSLFPTDRLTFVNNTSISDNRIDGQSSYSEFLTGANLGTTIYFRSLGIRMITDSADLNYRVSDWLGFYGGYHYADRQVRTTEALPVFSTFSNYEVANQMQSGLAGVRLRPWKPFTINLDAEVGRNNQPLTPIAGKNFQTLGGRAQYRVRKFQALASYKESYNFNSTFSLFSSHSRGYTGSASWAPTGWFSLDASYNKLHYDDSSFLAFFAGVTRSTLQTSYRSIYISNIHAANLGIRFAVRRRADLYLGYSITKDVGDGRATATPLPVTNVINPIQTLLSSVQTFPLTYQSPLARVSIQISPKVRWNAGYQFYGYAETFGVLSYYQNFHAHTGFTSVLWTF
ncbi:MAG TPA: hypothetical protein VLY04_01700 [Bryobacteraceae bacterium]|nr:hypothetical protein [Bryobacteraceae bacterium]